MNPAGLTLGVMGIWVLCQVFPGQALTRLNILAPSTTKSSKSTDSSIGSTVGGWAGNLVGKIPGVPNPGSSGG